MEQATLTSRPPVEHEGSFWPVLVAAAATSLLLGLFVPALAAIGLVVFVGAVVGWIREDVVTYRRAVTAASAEGVSAPASADRWWASLFLILSETIVFGTLFTYYFWARRFSPAWPPQEIPRLDLPLAAFNTALLVASGWTAHAAQRALEAGRVHAFRSALRWTLLLGSAFLLGQGYEYLTAGFTPRTGTYGTAFFALTGVHGLHVLAGLVVLAILVLLGSRGLLQRRNARGVAGAVLYWHFVDGVWLVLFATLYLRWI